MVNVLRILFIASIYSLSSSAFGQEAAVENTFITALEPYQEATLGTLIDGKIKNINKKMGSRFVAGDILIELDDIAYKAAYNRSVAQVEKTKAIFHAKEGLYKDDLVSLHEFKEAEADYANAIAEEIIQKYRLEQTSIVAPFNGSVAAVLVNPSETVLAGTQLMKIFDDSSLLAKLLIPSTYIAQIKKDQPIYIYIFETKSIVEAHLERIGTLIDPTSSTIKIEAKIDNSDGLLFSGMSGTASFDRNLLTNVSQNSLEERKHDSDSTNK